MPTRSRAAVVVRAGEALLFAMGFCLLGAFGTIHLASVFRQESGARRLESLLRDGSGPPQSDGSSSSGYAAATRAEAAETGLVGRVEIPRTGLSGVIFDGVTDWTLLRGIGHLEETAYPGEQGTVALAAHRDTFFRPLKGIEIGDVIRITTPDGTFNYIVESTSIVKPDRVEVLEPSTGRALVLLTCYPLQYVGRAPFRLVVRATQIDSPPAEDEVTRPPEPPESREVVHEAEWVGRTVRFGDEPL